MKRIVIVIVILLALLFGFLYFNPQSAIAPQSALFPSQQTNTDTAAVEAVTVIAQELDTPWGIAILPDNNLLVTERKGTVRLVENGVLQESPIATLTNVLEVGEGGLLGITSHPDFNENNFVYLYYTYSANGNNTRNRVVRMTYTSNTLTDEKVIVDQIPGASNHNGGRIKFGPDKYLYITTGDAQEPSLAQKTNSLAGKILRVTDDGKPAPGNPFGNAVYSYGHRNPQGITWDVNGKLWSTEHGPSGLQSGNDEVNSIESGKNYGWPTIQGTQTRSDMVAPIATSGTSDTWAPGGAAIIGERLLFGGLRGEALYEIKLNSDQSAVIEHFSGEYGRIRDVAADSDGMLYITTSNQDGRGNPSDSDDRIIKINPESL